MLLLSFALLGLRLLAVAGRVDLAFDGGQFALVPVAQGLAAFHLAARLGHEVGVSLLDRVVQCDDGGLQFVVRFADLPAQQPESLGAVAAREAGPSDRRVQRLRLARQLVEASCLRLVVALLCGTDPVSEGSRSGVVCGSSRLVGSPNHW